MSEQSSVDDKAEQMMAVIRRRYGDRLSKEEIERRIVQVRCASEVCVML